MVITISNLIAYISTFIFVYFSLKLFTKLNGFVALFGRTLWILGLLFLFIKFFIGANGIKDFKEYIVSIILLGIIPIYVGNQLSKKNEL